MVHLFFGTFFSRQNVDKHSPKQILKPTSTLDGRNPNHLGCMKTLVFWDFNYWMFEPLKKNRRAAKALT